MSARPERFYLVCTCGYVRLTTPTTSLGAYVSLGVHMDTHALRKAEFAGFVVSQDEYTTEFRAPSKLGKRMGVFHVRP